MEEHGKSTIQDNFAKITGSALDPGSLADELFQRSLIGRNVVEEASIPHTPKSRRLHAIVMAVMGNGSQESFSGFVEAVRKDPAFEWLAQELIASYQRKTGRKGVGTDLRRGPSQPTAAPKPSLRDLVRLPSFDWYLVGLELDLDEGDLETISKDNPRDDVKARRELYRLWLKRQPDTSYQQLVDALCRAGNQSLAKQICEMYGLTCSPQAPPSKPVPPPQKKSTPSAGDSPTIAQLQRFGPQRINIAETIGVHYQTFGYFILGDQTGSRVSTIQMQCFHNPVLSCTEILSQWLQGRGVPERTWGKLVEVLRDVGMNTLADDIEAVLDNS